MGCVSCANNENEAKFSDFHFKDPNQEENNPSLKGSNPNLKKNFIKKFESNLQYIGNYIPEIDFNSLISENSKKFIIENPLDLSPFTSKDNKNYEIKPVEFPNGNVYHGNWNEKFEMDGYGKYYLKQDKVLAEGIWNQGELIYSRVFLPNGDIYEGDIKNSTFNGKGKLISSNGEIYEGDFENGERRGYGRILFPDGTEYQGEIEKFGINGKGKIKWNNGYEYQGNFAKNSLSGEGLLFNDKGDKYEGNFENNKFHGKGKYTHKNGDIYDGDFEIGIRKGKGAYLKNSGLIFEGNWDNNFPNGFGKIMKDKVEIKSTWRNGKIAESPVYEKGKEGDISEEELNFIPQEMEINTKLLTWLENYDVSASQYKAGNLPSFLDDSNQ